MSCNNSTAPIDISQGSVKAECSSKCSYIHNYPKSKCIVHNKGGYLAIEHSATQVPPVKYNSTNMEVADIRVYIPSIHTYSGKREAGEIVINHRGDGDNLLVCIPIKKSEESSTSTHLLETIIKFASSSAPRDGESVNVNLSNFTLEEFIPKSPFYSYEGSLMYNPCSGTNNYVVYHPSNGYVALSKTYLNKLSKIISTHSYSTQTGPMLFYNKTGNAKTGSGKGIYIDCSPVGEQGEILYNINKSGSDSSGSGSDSESNFDVKEFFSNPVVIIIISFIGLMGVYKITKSGWDKFKEVKE